MKKRKYKKSKIKKPKGYDKAIRNSIPLGDILSGKASLKGMFNATGMTNLGKRMGGPGTHIPVKASGKTIGTMADGRKIWLEGPNKGKMVN